MENLKNNKKNISLSKYFINLFIAFYFIILFVERLQSVIHSVADSSINLFSNVFSSYIYLITILSLVITLIYLLITNRNIFLGMFTRNEEIHKKINLSSTIIAIGIILVSGMVHTEYTIAPLQFVSYGFLILAIIIQAVLESLKTKHKSMLWLSICFLIAFSMSIPVVYHSNIEMHTLFHTVEIITSLLLVCLFTFMLYEFFYKQKIDLLYFIPMLLALVLDILVLILRWKEEINWFVLISLGITFILYLVGSLVKKLLKINVKP